MKVLLLMILLSACNRPTKEMKNKLLIKAKNYCSCYKGVLQIKYDNYYVSGNCVNKESFRIYHRDDVFKKCSE